MKALTDFIRCLIGLHKLNFGGFGRPYVPFRSYLSLLFNFEHCIFERPFGGLGTTYDVHLGLIGKRAMDFLFMLIERFARCYG